MPNGLVIRYIISLDEGDVAKLVAIGFGSDASDMKVAAASSILFPTT
jgi:hypothetical protein